MTLNVTSVNRHTIVLIQLYLFSNSTFELDISVRNIKQRLSDFSAITFSFVFQSRLKMTVGFESDNWKHQGQFESEVISSSLFYFHTVFKDLILCVHMFYT